jgi:hypothetical protein
MTFELSGVEAVGLKSALDRRVEELREELVHTDRRELRIELRETLRLLEHLQERLNAAMEAWSAQSAPETPPVH